MLPNNRFTVRMQTYNQVLESKLGIGDSMDESKILQNRTQNAIAAIKSKLRDESMTLYNDLLILQLIIPSLCKESLKKLLPQLKTMKRSIEGGIKLDSSMLSILKILSTFSDPDPLLKDFLQCTIKDPLLMMSVS